MTRYRFIASVILSVIGGGIAIYLTWVHYNMGALVCGNGGCEIVQTSVYATMMGVPIAAFGVAMYATDLGLGLLRLRRSDLEVPLTMIMLAVTLGGTLFSAWLTWLQFTEINALCQWCLASAGVTALLFINELVNAIRLWSEDVDLDGDHEIDHESEALLLSQ